MKQLLLQLISYLPVTIFLFLITVTLTLNLGVQQQSQDRSLHKLPKCQVLLQYIIPNSFYCPKKHFSILGNSDLHPRESKSNPNLGLHISLHYTKFENNISFLTLVIVRKHFFLILYTVK
jgi:hypothetical protein